MTNTTRRAAMLGAAAVPVLTLPAVASEDPAIPAVQRWLAAWEAERRYCNASSSDDDPKTAELEEETRRLWQEMQETPPRTPAGLALMLAAFLYEVEALARGSHFNDPNSWYLEGAGSHGTDYLMLPMLWRSPAAVELFGRIEA